LRRDVNPVVMTKAVFEAKLASHDGGKKGQARAFSKQCEHGPFFVGNGPRIPPNAALWEKSPGPFRRVVSVLRPAHVLVLGISVGHLWDKVRTNGTEGRAIVLNGDTRCPYFLAIDKGAVPMLPIQHLSTAFSYEKWSPWVVETAPASQYWYQSQSHSAFDPRCGASAPTA
jgi:hypothetical protein